jgi:hypothetical protein
MAKRSDQPGQEGSISIDRVRLAYQHWLDRKAGIDHPAGSIDRLGRWWPVRGERQMCCREAGRPTMYSPRRLLEHCVTLVHVAYLDGVDPLVLQRHRRRRERSQSSGGT